MEVYRVNIDFEEQLRRQTIKALKPSWQREWEYLFWWIEDDNKLLLQDKLNSRANYNSSDLDYIKKKTSRTELFYDSYDDEKTELKLINWWGDLEQKKTISKSDLPLIRQEALQDQSSYLIFKGESPRAYPCVVKKDYSFSGKGVYYIESSDHFLKVFKGNPFEKLVIENFHKIEDHFSFYVFSNGQRSFYRTFSHNKEYRGCLFNREYKKTSEFLEFSDDLAVIEEYIYQEFSIKGQYGIDCYKHSSGIQPVCEINHRKTLASVCFEIFNKNFPNYQFGRSYIFKTPQVSLEKIKEIDDSLQAYSKSTSRYKILRLSPLSGQYFFHFLIASNDLFDIELGRKLIQDSFNLS